MKLESFSPSPLRATNTKPNTKMTTTSKSILIDTQEVERDYGFEGTRAIVDTAEHGRILIEDGFGGMDSLEGGCVRWKHGSAYKLQPEDTFESLEEDSDFESCGVTISKLDAIIQQCDDSRPYLQWSGHVVASIAKSLGI